MPQKVGGGGVTYALEASANEVDTNKEWKPEGNVIAQGEDGVPWELYENGYLLFKPIEGKDTLGNKNSDEGMRGLTFSTSTLESLQEFKNKIKAIGFSNKTYLPSWPNSLFFASFKNLEFFDGENLDLSKTNSLHTLFLGDKKLNNIKLENWDVSHIRTFRGMFIDTTIKKLDLSKWNFSEAPNSTKIDLFGALESLEEITLPESFFYMTDKDKKYFIKDEDKNISIQKVTGLKNNGSKNYWIRKEDKKIISDFSLLDMDDKTNTGTWTTKYNAIEFNGNETIKPPTPIIEFSNKFTDESMLLPEPANKVIKDEETDDYYIFTSWTAPRIEEKDGPLKDMPVKTISDVKESYKTIFKTIETIKGAGYLVYTVDPRYEKIENVKREQLPIKPTVLYKGDETLDTGQSEETDGTLGKKEVITTYKINPITGELTEPTTTENVITPMKSKVVKVGTKPTVTTIERDNKQIKQTTTYIVNEDTGELTPNTIEEIISDVKPATSNGAESPLTFELPKYTNPISTNTPIDENGDLVLPPTVDKLEYTGTLSTNTPIDKDGNLILPPIVDTSEYKDDIVNEPQKYTKEPQQPKDRNKQISTDTYQQSDKKQEITKENIEITNNNVVQKESLPKTNALHNSIYVLGLLLSTVGFKKNKKN